jgi:hypothetical protein
MDITARKAGEQLVLSLSGRMDGTGAQQVASAIRQHLNDHDTAIIFDLGVVKAPRSILQGIQPGFLHTGHRLQPRPVPAGIKKGTGSDYLRPQIHYGETASSNPPSCWIPSVTLISVPGMVAGRSPSNSFAENVRVCSKGFS